jgi:hypothetical protein
MQSVTSQYSESSQRDLASASPPPPHETRPTTTTSSYQNLPRGAAIAAASYGADAASSRHSLDRLSATPPPPPLPKRGEGPVLAGAAAEGRFDGHFTKYLKQQQQQQCYEEPQLARLGSPLRDNFVERVMGEPATALSPASIPLDLSKKKQPESSFRFVFYLRCVVWKFVIRINVYRYQGTYINSFPIKI